MPVNTRKNRYVFRSRISERKFRQLIKLFALDLEANKIAILTGLNRNTVNKYLMMLRQRLAGACCYQKKSCGEFEVDESYFGRKRVPGPRGRGAGNKTIVVGVLKRGGKVSTEIVPDCSKTQLLHVIRGRVGENSIIHTDSWPGYNGLIDMCYKKHYRVRHGDHEFAVGTNHINGIESFWSYTKARLARLHGLRAEYFLLHLKECEFRFNHRNENFYQVMLKLLRKRPLN